MSRWMLGIPGTIAILAVALTASILGAGRTTSFPEVVLGAPGVASAHATLERSEPAANSVLDTPPARILLVFTEPIEMSLADIKLLGPGGVVVDDPDLRPNGDTGVEFDVPALANGTYTVTIRVVSAADGHPTRENFSFAVGEPLQPATGASSANEGSGGPPRVVQAAGKLLSYLSLVAVVAAAFLFARGNRPARSRLAATAVLVCLATIVALVLQAWIAGGTLGDAPGELGTLLGETRFGKTWLLRVFFSAAVAMALVRAGTNGRGGMLVGGCAAGLALAISLNSHVAGHQAAGPLPEISDWVHLAAASAWVGGLWALALTMRGGSTDERRALSRFTPIAIPAIAAIGITGVLAWTWLSRSFLGDLGDSTYGRLLLFKLALLAPMLGLGAWHFLSGRRDPALKRAFASSVLGEAILGVAVFAAASYLASTPPSFEAASASSPGDAPSEEHHHSTSGLVLDASSGATRATLHLEPARPGPNTVDVALEGIPRASVDSVRLIALDPAGELTPVEVNLVAGPVSYSAENITLGIGGDWKITVSVRSTSGSERNFEFVAPITP